MTARTCFYARSEHLDGSEQEKRDLLTIRKLGFEPVRMELHDYTEVALKVYEGTIISADALAFRAYPDGKIGADVAQQIRWAEANGLPVFELPVHVPLRTLSRRDTDLYVAAHGG